MTTTAAVPIDAPASSRRRLPALGRDAAVCIGLFLLLFGFYAIWAGGHTYSSDEEGLLQQTRAFAHGTYELDITDDNNRVTAFRTGRDGAPVAIGGVGQSAAGLPLYGVGSAVSQLADPEYRGAMERLFVGFTNSWITALLAVVVFLMARHLGAGRRSSLLLALVYGLGTMAWPHAKTYFSEPLTALLVAASALALMKAVQAPRARYYLLGGAFAVAAVLARSSAVVFLPVLGAFAALSGLGAPGWLRRGVTGGALFVAGALPVGALVLVTNSWRYGSSTDAGVSSPPLDYSPVEGLYGLLLSPGKSLFLYAPIALVGVFAIPWTFRRRPRETALLLGLIGANLALFARFVQWHGDEAWGTRYMNIVLPFFVVLAAPFVDRVRWRRAVLVAGAVGVLSAWLGTVMFAGQYFRYAGERLGTHLVDGEPKLWRPLHFDPEWSPIVGHVRLLDDVATDSVARLDREDASFDSFGQFPISTNDRYGWYFAPPQLDAWWYWLFPQNGPKWLLVMLPAFMATSATGGVFLWRIGRRVRAVPA